MTTIRRRVVVRGRVQGVGYRWSCKNQADHLGVAGWVRNRIDGSVELEIEGEEATVGELVAWCRRGPAGARVTTADVADARARGETGFVIRR